MTNALDLLSLPDFRNELAQVSARSVLSSLDLDNNVRWRYQSERVVRNLTSLGHALFDLPDDDVSGTQRATTLAAAQAWEHLADVGEHVDRSTALLNSSIFYELAGYQANATCLARLAVRRTQWTSDPSFDGLISAFLQRLFMRVTTMESKLASLPSENERFDEVEITRRASFAVTAIGLADAALYFLTGDRSYVGSTTDHLDLAKSGFMQSGDIIGFNSVTGIERVFPRMVEYSTWTQLGHLSNSARWHRYLMVLARGLGDDILDSRSISELWPSQRAAVEAGLLTDETSMAIRMPTSAGKTRVAELAIVHSLVTRPGSKCVYIAPFRALASEVEQSFTTLFQDLGYAVSTIPGGFDQDQMGEDLVSTDDVLILTPEKLDLLFRLQSDLLDQVSLIVIDEGHIVADLQRGPKFELLVSRLRRRVPDARFLMMSAVVPDQTLRDFALWLGGETGHSVSTDWRPSLLKYGRLDWDGRQGTLRFDNTDVTESELPFIPNLIVQTEFEHVAPETGRIRRPKFPRSENKGEVAAEVTYRYAPLGPVLVFTMQTNWAESIASALLRRIDLAELVGESTHSVFALRNEGRALSVATEWLGEQHLVTGLLRRGIAFHHARLPDTVRDAIEQDFRDRNLGVLVATSTLAQGVNLPVRTVVMHGCRSQNADGTSRILTAREYWNIAGRAGRAGSETEGVVIHISSSSLDVGDFNTFATHRNDVERVESALHRMLRDLVSERISSEDASEQLDADILALLVEEDDVAMGNDTLAETFASSLFQIQALETSTPIDPLITVMTTTATKIRTAVPDLENRRLFASTGLSSESCQVIASHVEANLETNTEMFMSTEFGNREDLLDLLLSGLAEVREMETRAALDIDTRELLSQWIDGESVKSILDRTEAQDPLKVTEFIQEAFNYLLPWGASGYLRIAGGILGLPIISPMVANVTGLIKYGVPSPEAAWAMSAGVASRRASIVVANEYFATGLAHNVTQFRRWLGRLDIESVAERFGLVGAELESAARAILRSQPNNYLSALDGGSELLPMSTTFRPLRSAVDTGFDYEMSVGDTLTAHRDLDSRLHRNAIYLSSGPRNLGYLPADAARALAVEIDAGLEVTAEIVEVSLTENGTREFTVELSGQRRPGRSGLGVMTATQ